MEPADGGTSARLLARTDEDEGAAGGKKSFGIELPKKPVDRSFRAQLRNLTESVQSQLFVSFVILSNAVVIGLETDHYAVGVCATLENVFLAFFVCEISVRLFAHGSDFFTNPNDRSWNVFDLIIVCLGVMDFLGTVGGVLHSGDKKNNKMGFLTTLLRTFRLLRILRVFRLFRMMKQLYLLATGFAEALSAVAWVSMMLILLLYVCAIILTHTCAPQYQPPGAEDDQRVVFAEKHFGTIGKSMFSLFCLMSHPNLETVDAMYDGLDSSGHLTAEVEKGRAGMRLFFISFIILGSWSMLSLLTGVMSEHMIEKSAARKAEMKAEAEEKRKLFLKSLGDIFTLADADKSGNLTKEEFTAALPTIANLMSQEGLSVGVKDLEAVFETIDFDNSGTIDVDEFLFGMSQLSEDLSAKHVMDLQYAMLRAEKTLNTQVTQLEEHLSAGIMDLYATVTRVRERKAQDRQKGRSPYR